MDLKLFLSALLLLGFVSAKATTNFEPEWRNSEYSRWSPACNFPGNDFRNVSTKDWFNCDKICQDNTMCTHFTWTEYQGGTCWLKSNNVSQTKIDETKRVPTAIIGDVCGFVISRSITTKDDASKSAVDSGGSSAYSTAIALSAIGAAIIVSFVNAAV